MPFQDGSIRKVDQHWLKCLKPSDLNHFFCVGHNTDWYNRNCYSSMGYCNSCCSNHHKSHSYTLDCNHSCKNSKVNRHMGCTMGNTRDYNRNSCMEYSNNCSRYCNVESTSYNLNKYLHHKNMGCNHTSKNW
ncbi:MAG: hypothetical protein BWY67_00527 [Bacteroidetes bacterium ADurb.Bin397]|nr:MAG: hypothetical protein BWY67_00527 [Bacteroidetes bacterium ADurb.Bin397]